VYILHGKVLVEALHLSKLMATTACLFLNEAMMVL
jgi:hypothetical protein